MPNFTVKEYANRTPRKAISVEKGVSFRVRKVSNTVQRQWRYRFTLLNGKRDEITLPASGDKREHLAADLRMIAEWKTKSDVAFTQNDLSERSGGCKPFGS